jgi:hypothetical protein
MKKEEDGESDDAEDEAFPHVKLEELMADMKLDDGD